MDKFFSRIAISVILIITACSVYILRDLKFEVSLESFFSANDPELTKFHEFEKRFGSKVDDEYIFIALTSEKGIFDPPFLLKVDTLTRFLYEFDSITTVFSVTNSYYYFFKDKKLTSEPVIHYLHPRFFSADSLKIFNSPEFRDFLISKDGKSVIISAFNTPFLNDTAKKNLLAGIKDKIEQLGFDKSYLTAKILVEETYAQETKKNLVTYLILSLVLIFFCLLLLFRSVKALIAPFAAIVFSICWTLALITLLGYPIDIISSLLPPVLAVICMSDFIHVSTRYIEELRKGEEKSAALKKTFRDVGFATFNTSITTAVGFFSACITDIVPIRLFGLFAGIGVLLAFSIVMVLVFSVNIISPVPRIVNFRQYEEKWTQFLSFSFRKLIRKRYAVFLVSAGILALSVYYTTKIQINSSLLQEIPRENPILMDYNFLETQFSGTRPFEMALKLKDSTHSFLDIEVVREIEKVSSFLKDSCQVGMLVNHLSFIKSARKAYYENDPAAYIIPENENDVYFLSNKIAQSDWMDEFLKYMTVDKRYARISGKLPDLSTVEFNRLSRKIENFYNNNGPFHFSYKLTGSGVMLDNTTSSLTTNMFWGLLIDISLISLIAGIMFRSFRMILIALIPNMLPVFIMFAIMGFSGIYLKANTSFIFAIAFGIFVDDTIHFLSKFKLELSKQNNYLYAVKRTYLTTGKAMIITAFILLSGFSTLMFSSFGSAYFTGLLISISLVFALLLDLTLLPLLIMIFYRKK